MSSLRPGSHVFVDESKSSTYFLVAASFASTDLAGARVALRGLRHRGSPSIHMRKESERSRKRILDGLSSLQIGAVVISGGRDGSELERRARCLTEILRHCDAADAARLVIERDDSLVTHDRQLLVTQARHLRRMPEYEWLSRNEEPLLWAADAVAWSYAQGATWRARVQGLIRLEVEAVTK